MCGIAGFMLVDAGAPPSLDLLKAMAGFIAHRGPDGEGFHLEPGVGLAHRRLAILDLATGDQPMANEDGTVRVAFNGEIENYRALTAELCARGHRFATRSDTETLVHLYEERGEEMCASLRGFFAFAIWDARRRTLLLARDRFGEKPLYYAERPEGVYFASEAKALLAIPGMERRLDASALDAYLAFLHVPYEETFFRGIRRLMPGEQLVVREGRVVLRRTWWSLPEIDAPADPVEALRATFSDVVRHKLQADVPIGVFLSGGIDSGLVAAQAKREQGRVLTFTMGVEGDSALDERGDAARTAAWIGAESRCFVQRPEEFRSLLARAAWHSDEPVAGMAALALGGVARAAAEHVKVVLAGDGGDEAFVGYPRHLIGLARRTGSPSVLRQLARRHGWRAVASLLKRLHRGSFDRFYYDLLCFFGDDRRAALLDPETASAAGRRTHLALVSGLLARRSEPLAALQLIDWTLYLPSTLHQTDRMTMAAGLEARAPFLDHELITLAASLPAPLKITGEGKKPFLRAAFPDHLPPGAWDLPKRGFPVPAARWFRGASLVTVRDILLSPRATARGLFRSGAAAALLARHEAGYDESIRLYQLLSIEAWCRIFLDPPSPPRTADEAAEAL